MEFGDKAWSNFFQEWQKYKARGLTEHANWWPGLYREWCRLNDKTPDPEVLAFSTAYDGKRNDLKPVASA